MIGGYGGFREWPDLPAEVDPRLEIRGGLPAGLPVGRTAAEEMAMRAAARAIVNPQPAVLVQPVQREELQSPNARPTKPVLMPDGTYQLAYDTDEEDRRARLQFEAIQPEVRVVRQAAPIDPSGRRVGIAPVEILPVTEESAVPLMKKQGLVPMDWEAGDVAFDQAAQLWELRQSGASSEDIASAAVLPQAREIYQALEQDEARRVRRAERTSGPALPPVEMPSGLQRRAVLPEAQRPYQALGLAGARQVRRQRWVGRTAGPALPPEEMASELRRLAVLQPVSGVGEVRSVPAVQGELDLGPSLTAVPVAPVRAEVPVLEEVVQRTPVGTRMDVLQPMLSDSEALIAKRMSALDVLARQRDALRAAGAVAIAQPPERRAAVARPASVGFVPFARDGNERVIDAIMQLDAVQPGGSRVDDIRMTPAGIWPEGPGMEDEGRQWTPGARRPVDEIVVPVMDASGRVSERRIGVPDAVDPDTGNAIKGPVQQGAAAVLEDLKTPMASLPVIRPRLVNAEALDRPLDDLEERATRGPVQIGELPRGVRGAYALGGAIGAGRRLIMNDDTGQLSVVEDRVGARMEPVYLPKAEDGSLHRLRDGSLAVRIGSGLPYRDYGEMRAALREAMAEAGLPSRPGLTPLINEGDSNEGGRGLTIHELADLARKPGVTIRDYGTKRPVALPEDPYAAARQLLNAQRPLAVSGRSHTSFLVPDPTAQTGVGPKPLVTARITPAATGPVAGLVGARVENMARKRHGQAVEKVLQELAALDPRFARPEVTPARAVEGIVEEARRRARRR